MENIKPWIIEVSYGTASECYGAYSENNPIDSLSDEEFETMSDNLWNSYNYMVLDDSYTDEEYAEAEEEFLSQINFKSKEDVDGEIDSYEIIYDER